MEFIEYIGYLVIGLYSITILYFSYGWRRLRLFTNTKDEISIPVSIVIACRNEEENILTLLESLTLQNYTKEITEIIIINDHSADNTKKLVSNYLQKHQHISLFDLPSNKFGKKDALDFGIKMSRSDIIITTDADCRMNPDWLRSMMQYYALHKPMMIAGPVSFTSPQNIFQEFQTLEFLSLIGAGAGAIGLKKAIMCNGANLLFEKSFYKISNTQKTIASGDDVFLMLSAKKINKRGIHFVKSTNAIVYTKPLRSVKDFFQQRIRWASKSKVYRDFDIIYTAIVVALTNLFLAFALISAAFKFSGLKFFIFLYLVKTLVDLTLLFSVTKFFCCKKSLRMIVPLQLIYPFYIVITSIIGFIGNFNWKGRKFQEKG